MIKVKQLLLKLLQLFVRDVLAMKKLEIEKAKPTFIISVLKVLQFPTFLLLWQINILVLAAVIRLYQGHK